ERYTQLRDALTEKVQSAQSRCFPEDVKPERKFIGRSEEFRTLRELIEQHDRSQPFQPIAIHGVAGTGKSLFAKEFLTRMTRSFDGGVLFHSRGRDTKDVQSVLREWAELIGYDIGEEVLTPEKMRKIFENRSCVPTLIVLDDIWEDDFKQGGDSERSNIQKLIDSLPPYPDSTILLTTQLREEAEFQAHCRIFSLGQLADEDAVLLIRDRLGERADGIADDVLLKLSKVVDGHPLALELVIRNMGSTEVLDEDYIESLRSSFRDGLSIDGLVTHKDANTSVGESFKRTLQGLERFDEGRSVPFTPLFRALGIFPDNTPLTKELIFEVWDVDVEERFEVNRAFKRFEDLALLNPHPDDNGDYTMHPLIAAFAREILSNYEEEYRVAFENYITYVTDEADEYFSKPATGWVEQNVLYEHIFHAGDLLWNSLKKLKGIGGSKKLISLTQPKLRRRDERDIGKIELDEKGEVLLEMALDFVQAVMPYIRERTVVLDQKNAREERGGLGWLRIGLVAARLSGENEVVAQVCSDLGRLLRWTGQLDESVEYFDASLAMMADDPQQNAELYATNLLEKAGILSYVSSENMDEARQLVEQARALSVHSRNPEQEAKEYIVLGRNFWAKGLATQALEYYEDALKIHENGWIYNKVGSGYFSKADYDRAIEFFEKGVEVSRADGKIRWEAENYNDMGAAYIYKQEPAKAREALKRALELYEKAGDLAVEVVVYTNMGAVSRQLGEYEQSLEEFAQARAIIDHVGQQKLAREAGMYYNNQGMTYLDMGRHEDALDSFNSGVALGIDNVRIKTGLLVNRGWLWYEGFGDAEKGCADLQAGVAIMEESGTTRTHGNITREEADRRLREVCDKLG
ncbi:MAG: tetratricopeptide repeat protein, partial [Chloroflexota bacterium]